MLESKNWQDIFNKYFTAYSKAYFPMNEEAIIFICDCAESMQKSAHQQNLATFLLETTTFKQYKVLSESQKELLFECIVEIYFEWFTSKILETEE